MSASWAVTTFIESSRSKNARASRKYISLFAQSARYSSTALTSAAGSPGGLNYIALQSFALGG